MDRANEPFCYITIIYTRVNYYIIIDIHIAIEISVTKRLAILVPMIIIYFTWI